MGWERLALQCFLQEGNVVLMRFVRGDLSAGHVTKESCMLASRRIKTSPCIKFAVFFVKQAVLEGVLTSLQVACASLVA